MKGVIGKFFLQFGVTLCVAVLLSYVEAITLAPARCAQLLKTVARGPQPGRAHVVDRGFDRLERALRARAGAGAARPLVGAGLGAVVLLALRCCAFASAARASSCPRRTRAGSWCACRPRWARTWRRPTGSSSRPRRSSRAPARGGRACFAVIGGFGGGGVNTGMHVRHPGAAGRAQAHPGASSASVLRKELNAYPGLRAVVQDLSQAGFTGAARLPGRVQRARLRLGRAGGASDAACARSCAASGMVVDVDTDYQLGMPELRITPDRARAADLGVSMEDVATTRQRAGRRRARGQVQHRRPAHRRAAAPARRPALAARGPGARSRCAPRSGRAGAALVAGDAGGAAGAAGHHPPDRERAITIFANVAPRATRRRRRSSSCSSWRKRAARRAPASCSAAPSVAFQESMGGLLFALLPRASSSRTWCWRRSSTRSSTRSRCSRSCRCRWRARRSRCGVAGQDAQHLQHDRPAAADGHREEELDHPRRLREPAARTARARARPCSRRARCACGPS